MRIWKFCICNRIRSFVVFRSRCLFSSLSLFLPISLLPSSYSSPSPFLLLFPSLFLSVSLPGPSPCLFLHPLFHSSFCFIFSCYFAYENILRKKVSDIKNHVVELIRRNVSPDMFAISPKILK